MIQKSTTWISRVECFLHLPLKFPQKGTAPIQPLAWLQLFLQLLAAVQPRKMSVCLTMVFGAGLFDLSTNFQFEKNTHKKITNTWNDWRWSGQFLETVILAFVLQTLMALSFSTHWTSALCPKPNHIANGSKLLETSASNSLFYFTTHLVLLHIF